MYIIFCNSAGPLGVGNALVSTSKEMKEMREWYWEGEKFLLIFYSSCNFDPAMHILFHLLDLSKYFDFWWHIIVLYHTISTKMSYYDGLMVKYSCLFKDSDTKIGDCNDR